MMQLYLTRSEQDELQDLHLIVRNLIPNSYMFDLKFVFEQISQRDLVKPLVVRLLYLKDKKLKLAQIRESRQKNNLEEYVNAVKQGLFTIAEIKDMIGVNKEL